MNISWYGHSCFKFDFKINNEEVSVVVDPYSSDVGYKLPVLMADMLLITHDHSDHNNIEAIDFKDKQNPMLINSPGEYEVKGIFVQGIPSSHDDESGKERGDNIIYRIQGEGMSIAHLGDLGTDLTSEQLDLIENVDILLIPVGGNYTINTSKAVKIMNQVEPKIVVPMHYKLPKTTIDIDGLDKFTHELGLSDYKEEDQLKLSLSNLTNENVIVKILKSLVK